MSNPKVHPPRPGDQRIKNLIAVHGGTSGRDVQDDVREAMALAMGQTAAWALTYSVDDVWLQFKEFMGIDDDDTGDGDLFATILTEDGASFLTKQDGEPIVQE